MFRNHKLEIGFAKSKTQTGIVPATVEKVNVYDVDFNSVEEVVKKTAILAVGVTIALKVTTTACKIAEIYASK